MDEFTRLEEAKLVEFTLNLLEFRMTVSKRNESLSELFKEIVKDND